MNIAINMSSVIRGKSLTGIGNYIVQVVSRILERDDGNQFFLISNGELGIDIRQKANVHIIRKPCKSSFVFSRYLLLTEIKKHKIDVYWSPIQSLPVVKPRGTRYCMTIYDIANLKNVNFARYNFLRQKLFYHVTGHSLKIADAVFSISEATRQDLIEVYHVKNPQKIHTIYLAGSINRLAHASSDILERLNISKPYFLYVGTLQPRKNIRTIVEGYIRLREKGETASLVLAGGIGWGMEEVMDRIKSTEYKDDIIVPGYIGEDEKNCLYENAVGMVFPSLYEGFGLPILEAFQYDLPVITAKNSSLPEVGGSAAIYMEDAFSGEELAGLMAGILHMSDEERRLMQKKGKEQMAKFSWDQCAAETAAYLK